MNIIQFIPKEFHAVKLGLHEREINQCTPNFPSSYSTKMSQIIINIPSKIYFKDKINDNRTCIPLCGIYMVANNRAFRYDNQSNFLINIKKREDDEWTTGEIADKAKDETPFPPMPCEEDEEKEKQEQIKKAKAIPSGYWTRIRQCF